MEEGLPDDPRTELGRGDGIALVIIDMLNDYDHPDGDALRESARSVLRPIAQLVDAAADADVPIIHINDTHGRWDAGREELTALAEQGLPDEDVAAIVPATGAPLLLKARHSVFYGSPLEYLLQNNGIGRLVFTGQVTEQCVLYSALDAYIRHFKVIVPRDAVAHIDKDLADAALRMMEQNMRAHLIATSDDLDLSS
ncbi:cysteine hydrolase family protein [Patulibacter minatonensis]|uniref:cysteine hydrolase family protein n=1 Tax=Patulibacter minatonensis TaxID=298163 RepID=UPI0006849917|nr:isochorismatase family cysteine hydrolase [Patulibacter minatonensis]